MNARPPMCSWCAEPIVAGERHRMLPPMHMDCAIRAICGSVAHQLGECSCYGGRGEDPEGLTRRQAARLAADLVRQRTLAGVA